MPDRRAADPFVPRPDSSLLRLSTIALVTRVWSCGALDASLQAVLDARRSLADDCPRLVRRATDLLRQLRLPAPLLDEVLAVAEWISLDLILYLNGLVKNEFFAYTGAVGDIVGRVRWDASGAIDEVATFRQMRYRNARYNYMLSAIFCLEEEVQRLSRSCGPPDTLDWLHSGHFSYAKYLILYWTFRVTHDELQLRSLPDPQGVLCDDSLDLNMLLVSLHIFNAHSFKYFWRRLPPRARRLASCALCSAYAAVDDMFQPEEDYLLRQSVAILLFALPQLEAHQRRYFVRQCHHQLILHFWQYWPLHHAVLPLFREVVDDMRPGQYRQLFAALLRTRGPYTPRNRLLAEMWLCSPAHLRDEITPSERHQILSDPEDRRFDQRSLQVLR